LCIKTLCIIRLCVLRHRMDVLGGQMWLLAECFSCVKKSAKTPKKTQKNSKAILLWRGSTRFSGRAGSNRKNGGKNVKSAYTAVDNDWRAAAPWLKPLRLLHAHTHRSATSLVLTGQDSCPGFCTEHFFLTCLGVQNPTQSLY